MECKFVVGQRVVAVRQKIITCASCLSEERSERPTAKVGNVYTVSMVGMFAGCLCRHGVVWAPAPVIDLMEQPSKNGRRYLAAAFRPVHTMEFWLGAKQELKERA